MTSVHGTAYGQQLKEDARRYYGANVSFSGRGEMIPNDDCYCEIDPDKKDKFGIPVLRFSWKWSDHEKKQAVHMQQTFAQIIQAMGGTPNKFENDPERVIEPGGAIIHEVGTTCIGSDPKKSVLNEHCQAWDVPNLFVTDGGPFASNADKNPTLTILALCMRSTTWLAEEMRKGNIG